MAIDQAMHDVIGQLPVVRFEYLFPSEACKGHPCSFHIDCGGRCFQQPEENYETRGLAGFGRSDTADVKPGAAEALRDIHTVHV